MSRFGPWIAVAAALACGSVDEQAACRVSADCPDGEYCARGDGESRCWPDGAAPSVSAVSVACGDPCLRDGVLRVTASVSDAEEVLGAWVRLDLDPDRTFPLARSGEGWVADVPLRELPFEAFSRTVVATVTARDGARNESAPLAAAPVAVTRLRWARAIDPGAVLSPSPPAVMNDGTVVVAGSNAKVYFVTSEGTEAVPALTVGVGQITAAPAIGQHAIWVGSEDFSLRAVKLDGSAVVAGVGVSLGGPVKGSMALLPGAGREWAFGSCAKADGTGFVGVASSSGDMDVAAAAEGFRTGPVLDANGFIHALTSNGTNDAMLRTFVLSTSPVALTPSSSISTGKGSSGPLALDAQGAIILPSDDTSPVVNRAIPGPSGALQHIGDLTAFASDTAVVLANEEVVVGDLSGRVHRFGPRGPIWTPPPNLGSSIVAPLVIAGSASTLFVATNAGKVHGLGEDGTIRWTGTLPAATGLRAPNLHTPPGQPAGHTMSHAYVSSANGWLFSVVVDGALDASAPWPKAFHDPRNTNRAGPQP